MLDGSLRARQYTRPRRRRTVRAAKCGRRVRDHAAAAVVRGRHDRDRLAQDVDAPLPHSARMPGNRWRSGRGMGDRSSSTYRRPTPSAPRRWCGRRCRAGRASRGVHALHERRAILRRSTAPSPRTASEMRKACSAAGYSAVGWNCTNSRFATATPARYAMATPSPVAMSGFVVCRYAWPSPPVASSTRPAWKSISAPGAMLEQQSRPCSAARRCARRGPRAGRWPAGPRPADARMLADGVQQRALDLAAGQVAGVHDAAPRMAAFPPSDRPFAGAGEADAPVHQVAHPRGPLAHERSRRRAGGTGRRRPRACRARAAPRESSSAMTAAMPPCA
jgi:hypothetical protein